MEPTRDRRFARRLLVIAAVGLLLRIVYILNVRDRTVKGDGVEYHSMANLVASGAGFVYGFRTGQLEKTAAHPPLWTLTLALFARLGLHSWLSMRVVAAFIGVATIIALGFAGRRIAGPRVGLIAAVIFAVLPTSFFYEWELMSETLSMLGAALTLLFAYRFRDHPSLNGALILGLLCGALLLTHSDLALLLVFLVAPLVLTARNVARRTRWIWLAAASVIAIALAVPWAVYNTARFRDPVLLSTEFGPTLAAANCRDAYYGPRLGGDGGCVFGAAYAVGPSEDESTRDPLLRRHAVDYIKDHLGRVPFVVAAREGRIFGVFRVGSEMKIDASRGTPKGYVEVAFVVNWVLEIAAIAGIFVLRRRRIVVYPLLAFVAVLVIGVAITYGQTRFRAAADVSIAILAAAAFDAALRRLTEGHAETRAERPADAEPRSVVA